MNETFSTIEFHKQNATPTEVMAAVAHEGAVAVLTLEGSQDFFFERDNGEVTRVDMQPGTLTIMRGYQPNTEKPRPYHWVAPALDRRLAISLRQMRMDW